MNYFKYIVFSIAYMYSFVIYAQQKELKHFKLNWIDNTEFTINKTQTIKTSLVENNLLNEDLTPQFSTSWRISDELVLRHFETKNVVYEFFQPTNLILNNEYISSSISPLFHFIKQRENKYAILNFIPIVKQGERYKRVVSFDLEYITAKGGSKQARNSSVKNSVLATGNWYKFAIDKTGVFKLDKSFLQSLGIDVNSINPKNIQVFGNGGAMLPFSNNEFRPDGLQENAIYVEGEGDGSFDSNDYVLLYGKGPHQWKSDSNELASFKHEFNIFSEKAYYFINIGNSEGKRISIAPIIEESATTQITSFHDYTFYEKDEVNLFAIGQQWFGESFDYQNIHTFTIPFENIDASEEVIIRVRAVAESSLSSKMDVKINNQQLFSLNFQASSGYTKAHTVEQNGMISLTGNEVSVDLEYNNNGNPSAKAYLDYIEILGKKSLVANDKQFIFRNLDVANSIEVVEYNIGNAANISSVWEVTNSFEPTIIQNNSTGLTFNFKAEGGVFKEYIVLNKGDYFTPIKLENSVVENQNLHNLTNLDYVVITQDYLLHQGQRLVDYHSENSNLNSRVIPIHQIYNEFSSGSPDITGIRDFIRHLYSNSAANKIKYVCFLGDASYDYKDRIIGNNNIVPVFEAYNSFNKTSSYVTDDFYGMMDDNEGMLYSFERQDVATGRIPVTDVLEAEKVIDKILNYYSEEAFGNWRTNLTLIADDIDSKGEEILQNSMEQIADDISLNKPLFNLKKIYMDAYQQEFSAGGNRYPTVNTEISNQVEKGTLMVDYFGHGGEDGWASEGILRVPDIQRWSNFEKLPLFITVTCQFSRFDNPSRLTAGEYLLWNDKGGVSSLISTTREIYISVGQAINQNLVRLLLEFNNESNSIAENLMLVKNQFSLSQRYFVYFLGDPAMRLAVPKPNIVITKMNDVDINQSLDTIKALSKTKFKGEVLDGDNNILSDFNGELDVTVYDKSMIKQTLDNDHKGIVMDFDVLESKIFTGRSTVENGIFEFDFIAPKDLKIAYGKGKVSFYAENNIIDKSGYNFDVVVGGINENAPEDNTGPVAQLYMNDLSFIEGGNTNQSPMFIAVIEDKSGINTSITAVDHDIVAIIDGDQSNPIILNDYYQTELNDFTKGKVNYQLRDLEPGLHTITLKVWDTYNNLSEVTLTFFVVSDTELEITNVLNYPNPFVNYTEFWFTHNKPNELLEVQIQIFTISGKLVKTINQTVQSNGNLSRSINWNGLDDFGSKIGKGVYIYKLKVKALNSNLRSEKTEKLVILQ